MKKILSTLFFLFFVVSAQAQSVVVYEGKDVYMPNATLMVGTSITTPDLSVTDDLAITGQLKLGVGTLAAAGSIITDAADITNQVTYVTASDDAKGVQLPAATVGESYDIYNTVANKILKIWPTASGAINGGSANAAVSLYGKQGVRCNYSATNVWNCGSLGSVTAAGTTTLFVPAGTGRAGATAGWVNTGTNINEATMAAGGTNATFTLPITGLQIGDTIESFKVIAQIESAGNTATLDADLRTLTNAAADPSDASIGAITQVSATADTAVSSSKTLATATVVTTGVSYYVLLTGTTAANTDVRLLGVEVVVRRAN